MIDSTMGCTTTKEVETAQSTAARMEPQMVDLEQSDLKEQDSSFEIWKWKSTHPGPPCRKMHEMHIDKLEDFMERVETSPSALKAVVQKRRGRFCNELGMEDLHVIQL